MPPMPNASIGLLRSMFAGGAAAAGRGALSMATKMGTSLGARNIALGAGSAALLSISKGMRGISRMGNVGVMASTGAIAGGVIGGIYGAAGYDTGVMDGAFKGAALLGGLTAGLRGARAYSMLRARGVSAGAAAGGALKMLGRQSSRFVGSSYNRAVNGFKAMKRTR